MGSADSLEKTLIPGRIEVKRRSGWQKMKWLDGITDSMDLSLSKLQEIMEDGGAWSMGLQRAVHDLVTERPQQEPCHYSSKADHQVQKVGHGPIPGTPIPPTRYLECSSHSLAYKIACLYTNWQSHTLVLLSPSEMAYTVSVECVSK